jgi:hypothetical protein
MKKAQFVYIVGDLHGEWDIFNSFINVNIRQSKKLKRHTEQFDELEVVILQVGDFGYWPHKHDTCELGRGGHKRWNQYGIKNAMSGIKDGLVKVYWCDGNHENHDALDALEAANPSRAFHEIMPGVYFASFGSILQLLDGTRVMFCGGADSSDKGWRILGDTWWPQEIINIQDMSRLPEPNSASVDWVISHTCPACFQTKRELGHPEKENDPSKQYLDWIFKSFLPRRWWFGHYHDYRTGEHQGCRWTLLNMCGGSSKKWVEYMLLTADRMSKSGPFSRICANPEPLGRMQT